MTRPQLQRGMTLLEVLIALSIFALIGVASYRVLFSVIDANERTSNHSVKLRQLQRVITLIDADIQHLIDRPVRYSQTDQSLAALLVRGNDYPLQLTRTGRPNPLQLQRSNMQRVAYDIGSHPQANQNDSRFYQDTSQYLRRHSWTSLDRDNDEKKVQALLANVEDFSATVITEDGRYQTWPRDSEDGDDEKPALAIAIEIQHAELGPLKRIYKIF